MRLLFIIINAILITLNISCFHQNKTENNEKKSTKTTQQNKIEKIQLTETTRGINRNSILTPISKIAVYNGDSTKSAMLPSEWNNIARQAEALDLSKISDLQSPTTGRFSDQALSSTFIITSGGTSYTSATFDAGRPPKELEALYNAIVGSKGNRKK